MGRVRDFEPTVFQRPESRVRGFAQLNEAAAYLLNDPGLREMPPSDAATWWELESGVQ